jgi:hypothetical protein
MPAKQKPAMSGGEAGTKDNPWKLKTPPGASEFEAYRDASLDPPALVVTVGKTVLHYHLRAIDDVHRNAQEAWRMDGSRQRRRTERSGGRNRRGMGPLAKKSGPRMVWTQEGLRGRFGMYVPPVLEALGLAELEHNPRNNRMRAV